MQTPAEKYLIAKVREALRNVSSSTHDHADERVVRLLNIGAGKSTVIENSLQDNSRAQFMCDRVDVSDCSVQHERAGKAFVASVESMPRVPSAHYDIAFANYVFEHVSGLSAAAAEVHRVLKPSGLFVTSLPNPTAPEMWLSKHTHTAFHQCIKGGGEGHHAHETHYAYRSIQEFLAIFNKQGFATVEIRYWSHTFGYLYRFPVLRLLSRLYDRVVNRLHIKRFMGNVCIVLKKNL